MKTIGLYLPDQLNEYFQMVQSDAEQAALKNGLKVVGNFADGRASTQTKQIHNAITAPESERPIAILTAPVRDNSLNRLVQQAASLGIGWVFLHRGIDSNALEALRAQYPAVPICLVTPDHNQIGRIQGRQILSLVPEGGNVVYVQGAAGTSSARERLATVLETTRGSNIEIQVVDGNWTAEDAERVVGGWLRIAMSGISKLHLIACQSDKMSIGARRALDSTALYLKRPEIARIPITGCDGLPNVGRKLVQEGRLIATIILPSSGGPAVDVIARALNRSELPPRVVTLQTRSFPDEAALADLASGVA